LQIIVAPVKLLPAFFECVAEVALEFRPPERVPDCEPLCIEDLLEKRHPEHPPRPRVLLLDRLLVAKAAQMVDKSNYILRHRETVADGEIDIG
jgi:hypothetical protein